MPSFAFLVFTNPIDDDHEQAFNVWYDDEHLPDILAIPGWESARRFRLADAGPDQANDASHGRGYLTIYEIEAPDPESAIGALRAASARGDVRRTETLEMEPRPVSAIYTLLEPGRP